MELPVRWYEPDDDDVDDDEVEENDNNFIDDIEDYDDRPIEMDCYYYS